MGAGIHKEQFRFGNFLAFFIVIVNDNNNQTANTKKEKSFEHTDNAKQTGIKRFTCRILGKHCKAEIRFALIFIIYDITKTARR